MVIGLNKRFVDLDTVLMSDSRWNRPTEDRRGYERGSPREFADTGRASGKSVCLSGTASQALTQGSNHVPSTCQ